MNSIYIFFASCLKSGENIARWIIKLINYTRLIKPATLILAILISMNISVSGQEMLGVNFSEYSGINGAMINPALMTGSKVFLDVNIIGGNVSASNDMAYFLGENNTISKLIKSDTFQLNDGDFRYDRSYNYYNNTKKKYLAANARLLGPSAMLQFNHHAIGLTTGVRSIHGGNNIPYEMPIIFYEGLEFPDYHNIEFDDYNYSFVSMTWSEIGVSYAFDIVNYYDDKLTVGVTAKALFGHEGGYIAIDHANYVVPNSSTVDFIDLDAEIGYSVPFNEETNEIDLNTIIRGYGVGFDIGFVYTKKESIYDHGGTQGICSKPYQDYKYKIGFSILDIGSVTFNKGAVKHTFEDASLNWQDYDTTHFLGFNETLRTYSKAFYNDPDKTYSGNEIKIGLPTVFSFQLDYHVREKVYVSALWMQPIRFNLHTLWRAAQIAVTPRYENKYIGISLPISLYNYKEPRIGLALRISSLTIGTEKLGSWLGVSDFTGMDIYFSLKFNMEKGNCFKFDRGACYNQDW